MKDYHINLEDLTISEIAELAEKALKGYNMSRLSLAQIGKIFLSHALDIDLNRSSFEDVRAIYIKSNKQDDVCKDENDFYKSIAKDYLWLRHDPKDKLLEYFYKATDDLKKIDLQLNYINTELNKLNSKKKSIGWLNGEDRYCRNLLEYYKEKNQIAKDEILIFISKDLESYSLENCYRSFDPLKAFPFRNEMPYSYSSRKWILSFYDPYDVRSLTELSNKFLNLPLSSYKKIEDLYKNNKVEFFKLAENYISSNLNRDKSVIDKIKKYTETNHIIANRKDIILEILKHYNEQNFISVVHMLPMQIEGIFHDICLEIGINESQLDISSINDKLEIMESKINNFYYFEYYSFKFPILRNKVAHGKKIEGNIQHTAIMLILDLLPVCELCLLKEIPINKKISLLDEALNDNFDSLIEMFNYKDIEIPSFYQRDNDIKTALEKYKDDAFWDYLENEVKKEKVENIHKSEIMKFIKKLNSSKLCIKKSRAFLSNMGNLIKQMKKAEGDKAKKLSKLLTYSQNNGSLLSLK
ncbi:hypothetical protein [Francisella tularensis]|uniref:hypothetical protein n=1 Tax=Francisella tularensis TaxID=263 RepID=UPI000185528F|nr:hypothetical protein [Francisella tularensis]APA83936.1 hypothetical protein N894_1952 [Francisella tularensis subsp. novicida PA10-7858]EDZ90430.1 hypothetical protein FTG_1128 [Francisella tularensis subsp. novicida FTG]MBK2334649.1 hypothetical protein [Francisella tularensis subsp. novicida]